MEILNEEGFKIDSDVKAEWALKKIKVEQDEFKRLKNVCEAMIKSYEDQIKSAESNLNKSTSWIKSQLLLYFTTVKSKETKTQKTYQLPSGRLVLKMREPEIKRNDQELIAWVKLNGGQEDFISVKETLNWAGLKKCLNQTESGFTTDDGEIVPGIELIPKDPEFKVEVNDD